MDPKQARENEEREGVLALGAHGPARKHMLDRALRESQKDEQKGIDVAAFTSSV